jgi:hypothetical protein
MISICEGSSRDDSDERFLTFLDVILVRHF